LKGGLARGRKDYTGGRNNFASLDLLNDPGQLARTIVRESGVRARRNGNVALGDGLG
jgi:hypothetical protein